jgi:hypothetical protein
VPEGLKCALVGQHEKTTDCISSLRDQVGRLQFKLDAAKRGHGTPAEPPQPHASATSTGPLRAHHYVRTELKDGRYADVELPRHIAG